MTRLEAKCPSHGGPLEGLPAHPQVWCPIGRHWFNSGRILLEEIDSRTDEQVELMNTYPMGTTHSGEDANEDYAHDLALYNQLREWRKAVTANLEQVELQTQEIETREAAERARQAASHAADEVAGAPITQDDVLEEVAAIESSLPWGSDPSDQQLVDLLEKFGPSRIEVDTPPSDYIRNALQILALVIDYEGVILQPIKLEHVQGMSDLIRKAALHPAMDSRARFELANTLAVLGHALSEDDVAVASDPVPQRDRLQAARFLCNAALHLQGDPGEPDPQQLKRLGVLDAEGNPVGAVGEALAEVNTALKDAGDSLSRAEAIAEEMTDTRDVPEPSE